MVTIFLGRLVALDARLEPLWNDRLRNRPHETFGLLIRDSVLTVSLPEPRAEGIQIIERLLMH
jgi:hypothetical protein